VSSDAAPVHAPRAAGPRVRGALPEPGERVPALAWATVSLFAATLTLWILATVAALSGAAAPWLTIPMHAAVTFLMFTVLHDASHYSISAHRWVNRLFGRLAMPFVAAYASFPLFAYIHIQHHRYANEHAHSDPDHYTSEGPWWSLPFRWLTIDLWYAQYFFRNRKRRPRADSIETLATMVLFGAVVAVCAATGTLWELAVVYLIPQRIGLLVLAWWFDWLPHHGLAATQRENRYQATRVRVGLEWLMTPLMLSQNYHLVHHLHPAIPFYRYLRAWRTNEEGYLQHEPEVATVFGRKITADEYRSLRQLDSRLAQTLPVKIPEPTASPYARFHRLKVAALERPTEVSVAITFDVPDDLRPYFRWEPGQHLTVRSDHGGEGVRRNYSVCASAVSGELRVGVKCIPGGAFSSYAAEELEVGDEFEVMTPTGSFCPALDPSRAMHYGAIAGGSGITPIRAIVETALEVESESCVTLVYSNRSLDSAMFREELDELASRFADRLEILYVTSREEQRDELLTGRLDEDRLARLLRERLPTNEIDEWYLCGPPELVEMAHGALLDADVDPGDVKVELFQGLPSNEGRENAGPLDVTFRLGGEEHALELEGGRPVLEGALDVRDDVPYACMAGACGTCKAKLVDGDVDMDHNYALKREELDRGYVLTCQAHPTTESVTVDYDA